MAESASSSGIASASSAGSTSSGILSLPAAVLSRVALATGDFLSKDFAGRGSTGFAATCHTLLESHLDAHPRTHTFALRYIPCGGPAHPRSSLGGHPLQWSGLKIGPRDSVIVGDEKAAQISSPGQLLRILANPETRFEELVDRAGSVTLYVDCRTLMACRDTSLDGDCAALLTQLRKQHDESPDTMSEFRRTTLEEMEEDEARAATRRKKFRDESAAAAAAAGLAVAPESSAAATGALADGTTASAPSAAAAAMSTDGGALPASRVEHGEGVAAPAMETDGRSVQINAAAGASVGSAAAGESTASQGAGAGGAGSAGAGGAGSAGAGAAVAAASPSAPSAQAAIPAPSPPAAAPVAPGHEYENPFAEPIGIASLATWMHNPLRGRDAVHAAGAVELRHLLQLCGSKQRDGRGGLRVDFSSTGVCGWDYSVYSAWAGVVRSFPNIGEMIMRDGKAAWLATVLENTEQLFPVRASLHYTLRLLDSTPSPVEGSFAGSPTWLRGHFFFKGDVQIANGADFSALFPNRRAGRRPGPALRTVTVQDWKTTAGDPRLRPASRAEPGGQAGLSALALAPNLSSVAFRNHTVIIDEKHAVADPESGDLYWVLDIPPMPYLEKLEWQIRLEPPRGKEFVDSTTIGVGLDEDSDNEGAWPTPPAAAAAASASSATAGAGPGAGAAAGAGGSAAGTAAGAMTRRTQRAQAEADRWSDDEAAGVGPFNRTAGVPVHVNATGHAHAVTAAGAAAGAAGGAGSSGAAAGCALSVDSDEASASSHGGESSDSDEFGDATSDDDSAAVPTDSAALDAAAQVIRTARVPRRRFLLIRFGHCPALTSLNLRITGPTAAGINGIGVVRLPSAAEPWVKATTPFGGDLAPKRRLGRPASARGAGAGAGAVASSSSQADGGDDSSDDEGADANDDDADDAPGAGAGAGAPIARPTAGSSAPSLSAVASAAAAAKLGLRLGPAPTKKRDTAAGSGLSYGLELPPPRANWLLPVRRSASSASVTGAGLSNKPFKFTARMARFDGSDAYGDEDSCSGVKDSQLHGDDGRADDASFPDIKYGALTRAGAAGAGAGAPASLPHKLAATSMAADSNSDGEASDRDDSDSEDDDDGEDDEVNAEEAKRFRFAKEDSEAASGGTGSAHAASAGAAALASAKQPRAKITMLQQSDVEAAAEVLQSLRACAAEAGLSPIGRHDAEQLLTAISRRPRATLAALLDDEVRASLRAAQPTDMAQRQLPGIAVATLSERSGVNRRLARALLLAIAYKKTHQWSYGAWQPCAANFARLDTLARMPRAYVAGLLRRTARQGLQTLAADTRLATAALPDAVEALDALRRRNASCTSVFDRGSAVVVALESALPALQAFDLTCLLSESHVRRPWMPGRNEALIGLPPSCGIVDLALPHCMLLLDAPGARSVNVSGGEVAPAPSGPADGDCMWMTSPYLLAQAAVLDRRLEMAAANGSRVRWVGTDNMRFLFCASDTRQAHADVRAAISAAFAQRIGELDGKQAGSIVQRGRLDYRFTKLGDVADAVGSAASKSRSAALAALRAHPLPPIHAFILTHAERTELAGRVRGHRLVAQLQQHPALAATASSSAAASSSSAKESAAAAVDSERCAFAIDGPWRLREELPHNRGPPSEVSEYEHLVDEDDDDDDEDDEEEEDDDGDVAGHVGAAAGAGAQPPSASRSAAATSVAVGSKRRTSEPAAAAILPAGPAASAGAGAGDGDGNDAAASAASSAGAGADTAAGAGAEDSPQARGSGASGDGSAEGEAVLGATTPKRRRTGDSE